MSTYCYARGNPRKIIEKALGRELTKDEEVHHVNGCRKDNRPENLVALTMREHKALHSGKPRLHLKKCPVCGSKKYETSFAHVRIEGPLARRLRKIAFFNHRHGIQTDTNLAVEEYCDRHEVLNNKRDNGR